MPSRSLVISKDVQRIPRETVVQVGQKYTISRPSGDPREGKILEIDLTLDKVYVSYVGQDKRLDAWVPRRDLIALVDDFAAAGAGEIVEKAPTLTPSTSKRQKTSDVPIEVQRLSGYNGSPPAHGKDSHGHNADVTGSQPGSPEREHASMTRVRNFEDVRFGDYVIQTWYYSPYPLPNEESQSGSQHLETPTNPRKRQRTSASPAVAAADTSKGRESKQPAASTSSSHLRKPTDMFAKGVEGSRGRLWVCDLCFKYMKERSAWKQHTTECDQLRPPGRKVYQRGSHTMWEIDGSEARLYCQNLSLFGKLFIDHKTVFFYVDNFKYYVLCDAVTSKRDQVIGFFSKEKVSYDDYNLACIIAFPPYQNRGFGKLLMEFSYFLTLHPSTRFASLSPGTPERPLSDLGLKGYTAYWISKLLRLFRELLEPQDTQASPIKQDVRARRSAPAAPISKVEDDDAALIVNGVAFRRTLYKTHHSLTPTLGDIAKACHLRLDDAAFAMEELGFLSHTRAREDVPVVRLEADDASVVPEDFVVDKEGRWKGLEVIVTREMVLRACDKWKVRPTGVLNEQYVLL